MTDKHTLVERLQQQLEIIQDYDRPLPWVVHSGSSYRRIASKPTRENPRSFPDGNVLHGIVDRHDGHHDLSMGEAQLVALVAIINAIPELCTRITALEAREAELVERLSNAAEELEYFVEFARRQSEFEGDAEAGFAAVREARATLAKHQGEGK
jgi:hypothetical protein